MRGVAPAGVLGLARVVAADAPREVLRGVACDEHGDARRARAGEGLTGDGACVGIDDEGGHGGSSFSRVIRFIRRLRCVGVAGDRWAWH